MAFGQPNPQTTAASDVDSDVDSELERVATLANTLTNNIPFCPEVPNPVQRVFLLDFGRESLYGGAAGGGKSWALLMAASQFLDIPGYAALILRKSFRDLNKPGALMDIAKEWWGPYIGHGVRFLAQENSYEFACPGGGHSRVVFGALDEENDRFKYQGGAYHFIGWDEITQQKERDYLYVSFSRVRRPEDGPLKKIPMRVRATANPGGTGHDWVRKRFILPYKAWKFPTNPEFPGPRPKVNFHPATIDDNPKLDRKAYVESLMELDPVTRAQLMKGDWDIRPDGRMFKSSWFKVIPLSKVPKNCTWVRFWDMASTDKKADNEPDFTAGALVGRSPRGQYYIIDMRHWRHEPAENDLMVMATAYYDSARIPIRMEQEGGASGKIAIHHYRTTCFDGFDFRGVPAVTKGSKTMAAAPVASQADAGNVFMVEAEWNSAFLDEIELFPDVTHDDQVDALSGAFRILAQSAHLGFALGPVQDDLTLDDSGWRPDATPNFSFSDISSERAILGKRDQADEEDSRDMRIIATSKLTERISKAWEM